MRLYWTLEFTAYPVSVHVASGTITAAFVEELRVAVAGPLAPAALTVAVNVSLDKGSPVALVWTRFRGCAGIGLWLVEVRLPQVLTAENTVSHCSAVLLL